MWKISIQFFVQFLGLPFTSSGNCRKLWKPSFRAKTATEGLGSSCGQLGKYCKVLEKKLYSTVLACISGHSWSYPTTTYLGRLENEKGKFWYDFLFHFQQPQKNINSCGKKYAKDWWRCKLSLSYVWKTKICNLFFVLFF